MFFIIKIFLLIFLSSICSRRSIWDSTNIVMTYHHIIEIVIVLVLPLNHFHHLLRVKFIKVLVFLIVVLTVHSRCCSSTLFVVKVDAWRTMRIIINLVCEIHSIKHFLIDWTFTTFINHVLNIWNIDIFDSIRTINIIIIWHQSIYILFLLLKIMIAIIEIIQILSH